MTLFKDGDIQKKIPYQINSKFTPSNVNSIRHYQDKKKSNNQSDWDYVPLPKEKRNDKLGMDCFMLNNYLRGTLSQKLSKHDENQLIELIKNLDSAIEKSRVPYNSLILFRGIECPNYWLNRTKHEDITDSAYSSFTQSKPIAEEYANKNKLTNDRVYLMTKLRRGDKALYLDKLEDEWLLPRNSRFEIREIDAQTRENASGKTIREIVYYLDKVN